MHYASGFFEVVHERQFPGTFIEAVSFNNGSDFQRVIRVSNPMSLNQLIAKWREYIGGRTFFRGQRNFYEDVPICSRDRKKTSTDSAIKQKSLEMFLQLPGFAEMNSFLDSNPGNDVWKQFDRWEKEEEECTAFSKASTPIPAYALEGILQHYVGGTSWIDVVDNPLVALWMATRNYDSPSLGLKNPQIKVVPAGGPSEEREDVFLYLYGQRHFELCRRGLYECSDSLLLDLREVSPSAYLRTHAQGGMLLKSKNIDGEHMAEASTTEVVALQLDRDMALAAVGDSTLLSVETLFPRTDNDVGFGRLAMLFNVHWVEGFEGSEGERREKAKYLPPIYVP